MGARGTSEALKALEALSGACSLDAEVHSASGEVLWSVAPGSLSAAGDVSAHPVTLAGEVLGEVRGGAGAAALAELLAHLAREQEEKRALTQDSLARYTELGAIYDLARKLAGNLKPDQVAETVLAEAAAVIRCDRAFVLVRREEGEGLELLAHTGPRPSDKLTGRSPQGIPGAIFASGQPEIVNHVPEDPRHVPGAAPVHAFIGAPLLVKGKAMGVLCLSIAEPHVYRTEDLSLLAALCVLAASAIENARLYRHLERRVAARTLELFEALNRFNHELVKAGEYVKSLIPAPLGSGPVRTDWRFVPSTSLGGDVFGYHWLDEDHFALFVLDVCGHGVGAALLSVSVMNVLRSRNLPGTDFTRPDQVLASLNRSFPMAEQNGLYFTIWYGVYDRRRRELAYASAGHFPALFFQGAGCDKGPMHRLGTENIFIGGVPGFPFVQAEFQVPAPGRLYVYTDGAFEHRLPDGSMWEFDDFAAFLAASDPDVSDLDRLLRFAQQLHQSPTLKDDFTILEVTFGHDDESEGPQVC
jgi:serine phosphatase RsbU (regulator of sigma subunit)/putative methionine-R-sulfoxide reductase with GAF domain